ncbi:MAG: hypothetical protein ACM3SP_03980, partial [Chloroflexota bacterium]
MEAIKSLPSFAQNRAAIPHLKYCILASATLSGALGLFGLAAWLTGNTMLVKILAGAIALQPNTAIGFLLCGAALFAARRGMRRVELLFGIGVELLGLVTISEYLFNLDLRINEALLGLIGGGASTDLAPMAPSTAIGFLLAGTAFAIAWDGQSTPARRASVGSLGAIVLGIGAVACVGYLTDLSATYAWDRLNGMALLTALGFVVVGGGLVAIARRRGNGVPNASPRWLPLFVGVSCLTATLVLWQAFLASDNAKIRQLIRDQEINVHNRITSNINSVMFELIRSATRWERYNLESPERIQDEAALLLQWLRGLHAIAWLDENNRVRWMVPKGSYPRLVGADLSADPHHLAALETTHSDGMALVADDDAIPGNDRYFIYAP